MRTLTPGQKLVKTIVRKSVVCLDVNGKVVNKCSRHAVAWATELKKWKGDNYPTVIISDVVVKPEYPNLSAFQLIKLAN